MLLDLKKKTNSDGQSTLEAALGLFVTALALSVFLASSFHITGWVWSRYWAYQSLHCVFEQNREVIYCRQDLERQLRFHPGHRTAVVNSLSQNQEAATLRWVYHLNFGFKKWSVEREWTLKRPKPRTTEWL